MRSKRIGLSRIERIEDRAERAKALYFSLIVSLVSVIMSCFCLFGTTYALFTSTASTDNNTLGTGFLSVSLHDVQVENNKANIEPSELIYDTPMLEETQNISKENSISKYFYVRNNSTVDTEYSLSFIVDENESSNEEEELSTIADYIDVSYCKVVLDNSSSMEPQNSIYLGKLSSLLIDENDNNSNNDNRKIMGVLSKLRTSQVDIVDVSDISYPIGQLYKINFSLNTDSDIVENLSNLPINIVLNSTQRDLDIYQISVIANAYDVGDLDNDPVNAIISCTNFIGAGDYYAGNYDDTPIDIQIKNKITCETIGDLATPEFHDYKPVKYSINGGTLMDIDNYDETSEYSIISIDEVDKDIEIEVKYQKIIIEQK